MNIVIGADHRGFLHKESIKQKDVLAGNNITWIDVGTHDAQRTDYPIFVQKACELILNGQADYGIVLCGSGIGMSIAANRFSKIYAGLVWNEEVARMSRADDNTNVLVIPADFVDANLSIAMIEAWLSAEFKGGRYADRLHRIDQYRK